MPDISNPINIDQGSDWTQGVSYKVNGQPFDLSGYTVECEIRTAPYDVGGLLVATPTHTIDAVGHFILQMSAAQTNLIILSKTYSPLIKEKFWYDVYIIAPGGQRSRILNGPVFISPRVSQ